MDTATDLSFGWRAQEVADDNTWQIPLSESAVRGFEQALDHAQASGKAMLDMTPSDFPLSDECLALLRLARQTTQGRWGFALLSGFPVNRWSENQTRLAFWGVGLHLGVARPQNINSDYLTDVRDAGGRYRGKGGRGYNTNAGLDFHIDSGDLVGLMCRRIAKSGGESKLTSSKAIYQAVVSRHPDLAEVLREPLWFSWQGAMAKHDPPCYACPVVDFKDDYFAFRFNLKNIIAAQRDFTTVPRLSTKQQELIDVVVSLFPDPEFCYSMELKPGDLQLVNNYHVIHSRTAFEDFRAFDHKRHLIRLWLCIPDCPALPDSWATQTKQTGRNVLRGGLRGSHVSEAFLQYEQRQAQIHGLDARYYRKCPR